MQKKKQVNTVEKLKLLDSTITIHYVDNDMCDSNWLFGHTSWKANEVDVYISTKDEDGKKLSEDTINYTLRHELFHVILGKLYFETETRNEPLVEWLAQSTKMLHDQGINI